MHTTTSTNTTNTKENTDMNPTGTTAVINTNKENTAMTTLDTTDLTRTAKGITLHQVEHTVRYLQGYIATDKAMTNDGINAVSQSFTFPGNGTWGFALPDLIYTRDHSWNCTEINGPNGAGTSVHGADLPRVRHEVDTLLHRNGGIAPGQVILRAWSLDTNSRPEIAVRGALFAAELHEATDHPVVYENADHTPADDAVNVIYGDIPTLVDHLKLTPAGLTWKDHPVAMVFNQNLLGELARRLNMSLEGLTGQVDPNITHAGTELDRLFNDKPAQQNLLVDNPTIRPVPYQLVTGTTDAIDTALTMAQAHDGAFIKPSGVSGGTGAIAVDPTTTRADLHSQLEVAGAKLTAKYGPNWAITCPWAVYGFIHARPVVLADGAHRWDLRFALAATPELITITPLEARICPGIISDTIDHASSVSNMTGREAGGVATLTARELARAAHLPDEALAEAATGLAHWYEAATA